MIPETIVFCEGLAPQSSMELACPALEQLQILFNEATFWAQDRKIEDLEVAIAYSNPVISVWDQGQLVGFARATSDGVYRATIWDVVIHPNYRSIGLGKQLVETLLHHRLLKRVERVYLTTTYQQAFYKKLGFEENSTTTMLRRNHSDTVDSPERIQSLVSQG